jgi:hypothetical protein
LKNDYENANTLAHGGVGTFGKEKVLELTLINLVKRERFFGVLRTLGWLLD